MGTFFIRAEAGLWVDWKSGYRKILSKEDDPVNFDPQMEEKGRKWETHKGKRAGKLTVLVEVWGVDLGTFSLQ